MYIIIFRVQTKTICGNLELTNLELTISVSHPFKKFNLSGVSTFGGKPTIGGIDFWWQTYYRGYRLLVANLLSGVSIFGGKPTIGGIDF